MPTSPTGGHIPFATAANGSSHSNDHTPTARLGITSPASGLGSTGESHGAQAALGEASVPFPLLRAGRDKENRRPSIQFLPHSNSELPRGEPKRAGSRGRRSMSSPPPPPVFQRGVSFDTWERQPKDETSFTLVKKHKNYAYTKRSRTFLCGLDSNDYSEYALEWLIDELVDDGDEVVCLRVVDPGAEIASFNSIQKGRYRDEAEATMKHIEDKNHEHKAINLVLEFAVGKVEKVFTNMIRLYEPAIVIVGTRGRSLGGLQGLLPGSISKFCLQNSPVPVIVVRPNNQRARGKRKRQNDPSRQGYRDLLDKSGPDGGHLLDASNRSSILLEGTVLPAAADEAVTAQAAAVVARTKADAMSKGSPLAKVQSVTSDVTSPDTDRDDSPEDVRVMKSPTLQNLESPELSPEDYEDEEDEYEEEDGASPESVKNHSKGVQLPADDLARFAVTGSGDEQSGNTETDAKVNENEKET